MRKTSDPVPETGIEQDRPGGKTDLLMEVLDWVKYILFAILLGLLIVTFVVQRNSVIGHSMDDTLNDQDQLIVEKVSKWFNGIQHGDIITITTKGLPFHDGDINIVKRVIGIPGDTVEVKDKTVYVNGMKITEPYLRSNTSTEPLNAKHSKVTLVDNQYFVLGDNRGNSTDSRVFGPVDKSLIIGEVLLRVTPLSKFGIP